VFVLVLGENHAQETVLLRYEEFESIFGVPGRLLSDRGVEFGLITGVQFSRTAAYHPEGNSLIERFHKELANLCRIHNCLPVDAVKFYRTDNMRQLFFQRDPVESKEVDYGAHGQVVRSFQVDDLVQRFVPRRSRTKASDVWSLPMRVCRKLGDRDYVVFDGYRRFTCHVNDLKKVIIPSGAGWQVNQTILNACWDEWQVDPADFAPGCNSIADALQVCWSSKKIFLPVCLREQSLVLDKFNQEKPEFVVWVVPNLPAEDWFKKLEALPALWIPLAKAEDSLVDPFGDPVGLFCIDLWIVLMG
jgi:hypothetical protein